MSLVLYYAPGTSAFASLVALEEAGAAYETKLLDLTKGEQKNPSYLAVNPHGRVPTLTFDGSRITENIAILTYVAAAFPHARLLPVGDPVALGKAYDLLSWFSTSVHMEIAKIFRGERFTGDENSKGLIKQSGIENFGKNLAEIEAAAGNAGDWMCGNQFSVVDAFSLVISRWAKRLEFNMADFPIWQEKVERAIARPAVSRATAREEQVA